ncbi:DnaB-like helicase C-terminal domain-containing protein [Quatrionicoccus australiensis]|uniref:DnaB-like helicase C-terminal domain-containing protein n=1 Tax=Quatrionicoccus australiensis TaxID=138118 RepID=UPI001CFA35C4|nr:DnaB-like helicase C-terminal domain-containing protein [Quatrionicoccus australiensis]MCB4360918.1 AAA family ATPase [Quatrionicoccus australiensis]
MNVIDDTFDFDAYLQGPDESAMVLPASAWVDEVIQAFERPAAVTGAALPWSRTHNTVRLRRGELSIWPGMSGHGKSVLIGQVALGLMAQGERVCVASMEMKPAATMQRMCRQAFASNSPLARDVRDLHAWTDGRLWLYAQMGEVSPERILAVARYCWDLHGVTHFIIDNLLSCGIAEDGYDAQKQFVLALATHAHDTGQAVHLLAHSRKGANELTPPGKFDVRGSTSITDLADNVFSVWRNRGKELAQEEGRHDKDAEHDALMIVCKHRHGEWEGRIPLWFDRRSQTYLQCAADQPKAMALMAETDEVEF